MSLVPQSPKILNKSNKKRQQSNQALSRSFSELPTLKFENNDSTQITKEWTHLSNESRKRSQQIIQNADNALKNSRASFHEFEISKNKLNSTSITRSVNTNFVQKSPLNNNDFYEWNHDFNSFRSPIHKKSSDLVLSKDQFQIDLSQDFMQNLQSDQKSKQEENYIIENEKLKYAQFEMIKEMEAMKNCIKQMQSQSVNNSYQISEFHEQQNKSLKQQFEMNLKQKNDQIQDFMNQIMNISSENYKQQQQIKELVNQQSQSSRNFNENLEYFNQEKLALQNRVLYLEDLQLKNENRIEILLKENENLNMHLIQQFDKGELMKSTDKMIHNQLNEKIQQLNQLQVNYQIQADALIQKDIQLQNSNYELQQSNQEKNLLQEQIQQLTMIHTQNQEQITIISELSHSQLALKQNENRLLDQIQFLKQELNSNLIKFQKLEENFNVVCENYKQQIQQLMNQNNQDQLQQQIVNDLKQQLDQQSINHQNQLKSLQDKFINENNHSFNQQIYQIKNQYKEQYDKDIKEIEIQYNKYFEDQIQSFSQQKKVIADREKQINKLKTDIENLHIEKDQQLNEFKRQIKSEQDQYEILNQIIIKERNDHQDVINQMRLQFEIQQKNYHINQKDVTPQNNFIKKVQTPQNHQNLSEKNDTTLNYYDEKIDKSQQNPTPKSYSSYSYQSPQIYQSPNLQHQQKMMSKQQSQNNDVQKNIIDYIPNQKYVPNFQNFTFQQQPEQGLDHDILKRVKEIINTTNK